MIFYYDLARFDICGLTITVTFEDEINTNNKLLCQYRHRLNMVFLLGLEILACVVQGLITNNTYHGSLRI